MVLGLDEMETLGLAGLVAAERGEREEAMQIFDQLASFPPPGRSAVKQAEIAAHLGDPQVAVERLRTALAHGVNLLPNLHHALTLESVWDHPAYHDLYRELELPLPKRP